MRPLLRTAAAIALVFGTVVAAAPPMRLDLAPQAQAGVDPRALEPWPDDAKLEEKRKEAETRRLFRSQDTLAFTLTADFGAIQRDRDPQSERTWPGVISWTDEDGSATTAPVQVRTRGNSRRKPHICSFAPLRIEFDKPRMKGTPFAGHNALKLGTHCRDSNEYEQYVLREYTAYRAFNALTPRSFRARLARATYLDAKNNRTVASKYAIFLEDDDDVAERQLGRIVTVKGIPFTAVDTETLTLMMLFEFMIGNTDWSVASQHNVVIVQTREGRRYPVPYDFDYSGLVDTTYSVPDKQLGIATVRDRLYRGPCRTAAELEPFFATIRNAREQIFALYDALPDMSDGYRKNAKNYLDEFYRLIDRPRDVKRAFIDNCNGRIGAN
jgi:hypothetical protein